MAAVDWNAILPGAVVVYSSMAIPDDRGSEGTVAEIDLPGRYLIDVSWFSGDYHVRLYRDFFENLIGSEYVCHSPQVAVSIAQQLAGSVIQRRRIKRRRGTQYIELVRAFRQNSIRASGNAAAKTRKIRQRGRGACPVFQPIQTPQNVSTTNFPTALVLS